MAPLSALGSVGRGKSRHRPRNDPSLYGGKYPFFQTGDVTAAEFYLSVYSQTYNEKGLAQSRIWDPSTLCITIAANIAETAILKIPGCFPDSIVGFCADRSKSDVRFVKYALDVAKRDFQTISKGTTQDNLSVEKLLSINLPAPPTEIQRYIANVLSAYDDLIENNTRRITILEEIARRLFEEWFGNCADAVWTTVKLGDVAAINPETIKPKSPPARIGYIDIASVSPGKVDQVQWMDFADAPGRARRIVRDGDVIWSNVRPNRRSFALLLNVEQDTIASTGFSVLRAKAVPWSYLYLATTDSDFAAYLTNRAKGSAYPAVGSEDFSDADILMPDRETLQRFHNHVEPMLELAARLQVQSGNLRTTRDLLLPKLISGEIEVCAPEEELDTATA